MQSGESNRSSPLRRTLIALPIGLLLLVWAGLSFYWSRKPALFDVRAEAATQLAQLGGPTTPPPGTVVTATAIGIGTRLLDKPGGYLGNDLFPPGVWLDDIANWEFGALTQLRDLTEAMRESFSRSQSQSAEDRDLVIAEPQFKFDNASWALPSTEGEYRQGLRALRSYLQRSSDDNHNDGQFHARADNLNFWLATVETRLGSLSQRLSASVGQVRIDTTSGGTVDATAAAPAAVEQMTRTPWLQIDDVYYESQGSAWALLHILKAVEVDFAEVLQKKGAQVSLRQIIRELEATQRPLTSPMVLNGDGFGLFANHSLVLASYISRAHAAIIDLRQLLSQG